MRLWILIMALLPIVAIAAKPDKKAAKKEETAAVVVPLEESPKKGNDLEIRVEGVLEVGFDINNKVNSGTTDYNKIGYGKIEVSARPAKKVRAEFGFEYKHGDSAVTVDKLYGQYNFSDFGRIRAGFMKKAFGLEERAGVEERYFHSRSIVNDRLEDLGFLDHELTYQYRHKLNENWSLLGAFSWSESELDRYLQNYSIEYETKNTALILATIIQHSNYSNPVTSEETFITTFISSLNFKRVAKHFANEVELTFGTNPTIKKEDFLYGRKEREAFVGALRVQEYFPINLETKTLRQIIPIAEASIYSADIDSKDFDAQFRAGLTFGFAKNSAFQWRNAYGTVIRKKDGERRELRRRRFDSEVVVVF